MIWRHQLTLMLRSLKCTLCILHTQNAKRRWLNSLQLNGKNLFILVSFIQALTVSSTETPHNNSNDCTDCLLLSSFLPMSCRVIQIQSQHGESWFLRNIQWKEDKERKKGKPLRANHNNNKMKFQILLAIVVLSCCCSKTYAAPDLANVSIKS